MMSPIHHKAFHPLHEYLPDIVGWRKKMVHPTPDSELDTLFNSLVPGSLTLVCSFYTHSATAPVTALMRRAALFRVKDRRHVLWAGLNSCAVTGTALCLAQEADVPFERILQGDLTPKQSRLVKAAKERLSPYRFVHWDVWGTDRKRFEAEIERFVEEGGHLLVIDSLDLVAKEHLGRDEAEWLRSLATRHKLPILVGQELRVPNDPEVDKMRWFWNEKAPRLAQISHEWMDTVISIWPEDHSGKAEDKQEVVVEVLKDPTGLRSRVRAEYRKASGWIGVSP